MRLIRFGKSDIEVSRLGFDCDSLGVTQHERGWDPLSFDAHIFAERTVRAALNAGINVFDSSPFAGCGRAELLLGRALRGERDRVLLTSRLICRNASIDVESSIFASMRRLRTQKIDILYVSDDVSLDHNCRTERLATIDRLRRQGFIGHVGLFITDPAAAVPLISSDRFPVAQLPASMLCHAAASAVLDACRQQGVGVSIVKSFGVDQRRTNCADTDHEPDRGRKERRQCFKQVIHDRRMHLISVGMRWEHEVAENCSILSALDDPPAGPRTPRAGLPRKTALPLAIAARRRLAIS